MLTSPTEWRAAWDRLGLPGSAVPGHPNFGAYYPWRTVAMHAMTRGHRRRVDVARGRLLDALADDIDWRLAWSAGKDSTALAALIHDVGGMALAFGQKDDMDYPGEDAYLLQLGASLGLPVTILRPVVKLADILRDHRVDLTEDLHGKTAEMSREHFYGLIDAHRKNEGYTGVLWGLRAAESRGRLMNRRAHGWRYRRSDGLDTAAPLADWLDIDVHAYLASRDVPLLPMYLCVDQGMDALKLRKSWYVTGGFAASIGGHYNWLRRWWPSLWELAVNISPSVGRLS